MNVTFLSRAARRGMLAWTLVSFACLSGCILSQDFDSPATGRDAATSADAAGDRDASDAPSGSDTSADAHPPPDDATDSASGDAETDARECGDPCRQGQQFLCGERLDDCGQPAQCSCPAGFMCTPEQQLCELRPDTEITRCDNGIDDDGDNLTDCADSDCFPRRNTSHPCWDQTHHVFVTRNDTRGHIEPIVPPGTTPPVGAQAADRQCQNEAGAAQLGGGWKAIISTKSESAASRLSIRQVPILNTRGELVATSAAGLFDGAIDSAITYDQIGDDVSQLSSTGLYVWTGTNRDGTSSGVDCEGWTSDSDTSTGDYGILIANNGSWISAASPGSCSEYRHLYCINGQAP